MSEISPIKPTTELPAGDASSRIQRICGTAIPMPGDKIDTDRIIPARFMRSITFDGLGAYVFFDERFDAAGALRDHPFNDPSYAGASILIVGSNFGCGSSREHAPQALIRYGIRCIIGESFSDIFFANCIANGIPAVSLPAGECALIMSYVQAHPASTVVVNLGIRTVSCGMEYAFTCSIPENARLSLISGQWDTVSLLASKAAAIEATAQKLPYLNGFTKR